MFCPNCGNQVENGSRFCGFCGARFEDTQQNAQTYEPDDPNAYFTQEQPAYPGYQQPQAQAQPQAKPAAKLPDIKLPKVDLSGLLDKVKAIPKKFLLIGGAAVVALILLIIIISAVSGGSEANYALYIKDSEIFYSDFSNKAPYQVTDRLTDGEDVSNGSLASAAGDLGYAMHLTEDGKTLYYMDKVGNGEGTLYSRSVTNFKKEPVKISSGVSTYAVSENGKLVTYLKGDKLYQTDSDKAIAKNVSSLVSISKDGKIIYYYDDEGTLYALNKGEEEKIGEEISIRYLSEDLKTLYYQDEDKIYVKTLGKDKEKLVSDVYSAYAFNEKGQFYFYQYEDMTLADFFASDEEHASWMETLAQYEVRLYGSLSYYDGKKAVTLSEACGNRRNAYYGENGESCAVFFTQYDVAGADNLSLAKLDEMMNTEEYYYYSISECAEIMITEELNDSGVNYLAIGDTVSVIDVENVADMDISSNGKTLYMLCDVEDYEGTMFKAAISGSKVGKVEKVDDDVSSEQGFYFMGTSDYFVYFKDVKDGEGELYVNGEAVDDDVYRYNIRYNEKENDLLYMVDYNTEKSKGTLKSYNGKKSVDVADDVYGYTIGEDGKILFMYDYSTSKYKGTLAIYSGSKAKDISDDVYTYMSLPNGDVLFLYNYSTERDRGDLAMYTGKVKELDEDVVALIRISDGYIHSVD